MKKPSVSVVKNGPFVVSDLNELTESTGRKIRNQSTHLALCRCGRSQNKPYCDGTHGHIDFEDSKSSDRQPRQIDRYKGKQITIVDDRGICSHAGYCTDNLPNVFRMNTEPWIDPDQDTIDNIIETIQKCPSGALGYVIQDIEHNDYSINPEIEISENGPYHVKGSISLLDDDQPKTMNHYALCRCGDSKNKPFCSGEHWYSKFTNDGVIKKDLKQTIRIRNEIEKIQQLALTGQSENSSMSTLMPYPDFSSILLKGVQLHRMPLNEDCVVNTKTVIGKNAKKPIELSLPFYVSHMSYGAISKEAVMALAKGTSRVNTAMCSGEGGMLIEARELASTYIYEQGTALFSFDENAMRLADAVEIKIGQGVKPGVGGHLPASKITPEIAKIRKLNPGEDSISPGRLAGVDSINDLIQRVETIREITDGAPIGIKFAAGHIEEDIQSALKANPDFITIDCRGGATGSSPTFLKDNVGVPAVYAITRARKELDRLKSDVTLCVTGGFRTSSDIAKAIALGADAVALATASLVSIGCLQSRICHVGTCPSGIATQNEYLRLLIDHDKAVQHFENFFTSTNQELKVFARSCGHDDVHDLSLDDCMTTNHEISMYTDIEHV